MIKMFTIIKVGYSVGVYGCSNEYFNCIYTGRNSKYKENFINNFSFKGLYGAENRIEKEMKAKGYKFYYCPNVYGQIKGTDKNWCGFKSENQAIEYIKGGFKND